MAAAERVMRSPLLRYAFRQFMNFLFETHIRSCPMVTWTTDGSTQERQDLQARMDEVHGRGAKFHKRRLSKVESALADILKSEVKRNASGQFVPVQNEYNCAYTCSDRLRFSCHTNGR
jgi:hypothetical protein